ncbi:MAG: hypothetical protein ACYCTH_12930 [Cellulomonas sp.]
MNAPPFRQMGSAIPVPDLGPSPGLYHTTPLATFLLILGAVGVILFAAQALGVRRRAAAGGPIWVPFVFTFALMVVPIATGIVLIETGKSRAMDRYDAYDARVIEARSLIVTELEAQYGVAIGQQWNVPTHDGEFGAVDLTMADGTRRQDCLVVTDGEYEIRCGSSHDPAKSTPLPLADPTSVP